MSTTHRHGSVDARTELFDIVRGTTACSPTVFYGLLARLGEPSHRQSFKRTHAHTQTGDAVTSSGLPDPVALRPTWKGNLIFLLVVAIVVLAVAS